MVQKQKDMSFSDFDDFIDDEEDFDDELDSWEDGNTETAEITYSIMSSDASDDSFEMEFSEEEADKLKEAEENGGFLDSVYISENLKFIHRKILRAIREDLEEKSEDPHDGMKEVFYPPACFVWERTHNSHQDLLDLFDEDDVEYTLDMYW